MAERSSYPAGSATATPCSRTPRPCSSSSNRASRKDCTVGLVENRAIPIALAGPSEHPKAMETASMTALAHPAPAAPIRVPAGTTAAAAVRDAGLPGRGAPDAIVVVRDADGKLRDLSWIPDADVDVVPVAADTDDGRSVIRHSAAHVLAQAVQDLFP